MLNYQRVNPIKYIKSHSIRLHKNPIKPPWKHPRLHELLPPLLLERLRRLRFAAHVLLALHGLLGLGTPSSPPSPCSPWTLGPLGYSSALPTTAPSPTLQTTRSTSALVERKWCVCVLLALHFGIRSWHVRPAAKHQALEAGGASMILKIQKIVMVGDKHPTTNPHHQQLLQ